LWSHESAAGQAEGEKKRPCAIILAIKNEAGKPVVTVAPITHKQPDPPETGIEIPPKVKAHLGLDTDRSWIVVTELNEFVWPGTDIYPVPGGRRDQYDYGFLPPLLFNQVKARILALDAALKSVIAR
jgi:hypothetical protein